MYLTLVSKLNHSTVNVTYGKIQTITESSVTVNDLSGKAGLILLAQVLIFLKEQIKVQLQACCQWAIM